MEFSSLVGSFEELAGSPVESFSESGGPTAVRRLLVPWDQRHVFASYLSNRLYPHFPDCRVVSMRCEPHLGQQSVPVGPTDILDPAVDTNGYGNKKALLTVNYGPDFTSKLWPFNKPEFREGTELRLRVSGSGEFYQVPSSATKWDDDPETPVLETNETAIRISNSLIVVQWDYVDSVPIILLDGLTGSVNSNTFFGSPPETILFAEYNVDEIFKAQPEDSHTNRITCVFERRAIDTGKGTPEAPDIVGWNHGYREDPAGWVKLLLANGEPRYQSYNFTGMFL